MSWSMFRLSPDSAEPIRKMTMATWKTFLRPWRSEILPYSGVDSVVVRR